MATRKKAKKAKKAKKRAAAARKAKKPAKKASSRSKATARKAVPRKAVRKRLRGKADRAELVSYQRRGLGAMTGGQSGDTQGISSRLRADSESVEELLEEGQTFEAEAVAGVENAPDPDQGEVRTHEFPEDDVPEEYREED
jgi:hypothetical protein